MSVRRLPDWFHALRHPAPAAVAADSIAVSLRKNLQIGSLLSKSSMGLQVRAVKQNCNMACCLGVRTERVNRVTFAFGSGLAGMAGACLSQIGNVGPTGQGYFSAPDRVGEPQSQLGRSRGQGEGSGRSDL